VCQRREVVGRKAASYADVIEVLVKLRLVAAGLQTASVLDKIVPDTRLNWLT
jgi:hypothetical protein